MRRLFFLATLITSVLFMSPALASNDPLFGQQWGLQKIKAEESWLTTAGVNSVVAVVDTGVDLGHEDLQKTVAGWDFVGKDAVPQDDKGGATDDCNGNFGHGTHVAGISAATANNGKGIAGVAPAAKIMPVRVLNEHGCGTFEDVISGITWAADHGAQVINLSLGADVGFLYSSVGLFDDFKKAINDAYDKGAVVAVAAGNQEVFPSGYGNMKALVVGATDEGDGKAIYSNLGDADWSIMAPGSNIISSVPGGYGKASGTSMATPHVAGAAALLRCAGLSKQDTINRLLSTADDLGVPGRDPVYGSGRINLAKAVQGLSASACKVSGLGAAPSSVGSSSGGGSSSRARTSGSANKGGASSPAAPVQAAGSPAASSPSPSAEPTTGALGSSSVDKGGNNALLNIALVLVLITLGAGIYLWNRFSRRRTEP